ncbi:MAG TPA: XRE family transcriptional regulator [Candidatus Rokubacteria bacterium]|nr:XRE family transcriptional regulator [Candidatus Rokubacteria bacterium]
MPSQISELRAFGLAVRLHRERMHLSQEQLAGVAGFHRTYIGSVERGERNVTLSTISRLARALGITPVQLLKDADRVRQ